MMIKEGDRVTIKGDEQKIVWEVGAIRNDFIVPCARIAHAKNNKVYFTRQAICTLEKYIQKYTTIEAMLLIEADNSREFILRSNFYGDEYMRWDNAYKCVKITWEAVECDVYRINGEWEEIEH